MTNKDIVALMEEYFDECDDSKMDDFYGTDRDYTKQVFENFIVWLRETGRRLPVAKFEGD